jgi:hypothetical protein
MIHPTETVDHWAWFFCNCIKAGIDLTSKPIQSDRGHQRSAQIALENNGIRISLKFCVHHRTNNIMHKFASLKLDATDVSHHVLMVQSSENVKNYVQTIEKMSQKFPYPLVTKNTSGEVMNTEYVHEYLFKIHPISYCVFANNELGCDASDFIQENWGNEPSYGDPLPLFGWKTSSGNEGEHNAMRFDGSRTSGPLGIIEKWIVRANDKIVDLVSTAETMDTRPSSFFEFASDEY